MTVERAVCLASGNQIIKQMINNKNNPQVEWEYCVVT
jgi:hypothetical protein